jgi:F-type H+-transporting ATPase subunit b
VEELFKNLGIEWKILIAQAINFGILLFVLTKFVYKPITKVLDARAKTIEKVNKNADEMEKKLSDIAENEKMILQEARIKSNQIITAAEKTAKENADRISSEAEMRLKETLKNEKDNLAKERDRVMSDIKKDVGEIISAAIQKISTDSIDDKSRQRMVEEAKKSIQV